MAWIDRGPHHLRRNALVAYHGGTFCTVWVAANASTIPDGTIILALIRKERVLQSDKAVPYRRRGRHVII